MPAQMWSANPGRADVLLRRRANLHFSPMSPAPLTRVPLVVSVRFISSSLNPSSAACVREEGKKTEAMITSAPKQLCARQKVFIYMYFILFV